MILVDVYVPSVDNVYDFQLDEDSPIYLIVEEIGELIGQKEHSNIVGNIENLLLCSYKDKRILPKDSTLALCGIQTGNSLILV